MLGSGTRDQRRSAPFVSRKPAPLKLLEALIPFTVVEADPPQQDGTFRHAREPALGNDLPEQLHDGARPEMLHRASRNSDGAAAV